MKKEKFDIENLERKNPFTVPENYFEDFPYKVQSLCIEEGKKKTFKGFEIGRIWSFNFIAPAAMVLVLIYTGAHYLFVQPEQKQVSNKEIAEYIEAGNMELNEALIVESFSKGTKSEKSNKSEEKSVDETKDEAIIDYLVENDVDYSTIYAEF